MQNPVQQQAKKRPVGRPRAATRVVRFYVSTDELTFNALRRLQAAERRALGQMSGMLIEEALRARGLIP